MSFAILVFFTVIGGQVFGRNILENETNDLNRELDGITGETELLIQPLGSDNHLKGMVDGGLDHSRTDTAVTASLRLLDNLSHQVEISLSQISSLFKNLVKTSLRVMTSAEPLRQMSGSGCTDSTSDDDGVGDTDTPPECVAVLRAAENGETEVLRELLRQRPDLVNCRDSDCYTPLHRASYNGHVPAIRLLLDRGADPHARSSEGWQPLHSAVKWGHVEAATMLMSAGADINSQTNGGLTPAHIVSMGKDRTVIQFVIFHPDVDLSLRNAAGELAYDVALRSSPWHKLFQCV